MVKKVTHGNKKPQPPKGRLLALALAVVILILGLTVWVLAAPAPQKAVVGKWTNSHGGVINFYADGTGYIPGLTGVISDTSFTYSFPDNTHVKITIAGQALNVGIAIQGDKMTWGNSLDNTKDVYTRVK